MYIPPIHPGPPGPPGPSKAQDGQGGGLPRAVGAQQPEAFPRFDAKAWEPGRRARAPKKKRARG